MEEAHTMIMEEMLEDLIEEGFGWLLEQRARYRDGSRELLSDEKSALKGYFEEETLTISRVAEVHHLEVPAFVARLREQGIPGILDFRQMAGITFVDTIVIAAKFPNSPSRRLSLLFHELVHVVQCRILGAERLIEQYIRGWAANRFDYHRIPIEVQAYALQHEFDIMGSAFSVEARVQRELGPQTSPGKSYGG